MRITRSGSGRFLLWNRRDDIIGSVEAHRGCRWFALKVKLDDERGASVSVAVFGLSLVVCLKVVPYALLGRLLQGTDRRDHGSRETGFHITGGEGMSRWDALFDCALTVDVWNDWVEWRADQLKHWPWACSGWTFRLHPLQWLVGDTDYEKGGTVYSEPVRVPMPEGEYRGTVTVERVRWNRRWWNGRWWHRASIEVTGGVPVPGKGTEAWNIDDDATRSITFAVEENAPDVAEVVSRLVARLTRERWRRAGPRWTPDAGWPAHAVSP